MLTILTQILPLFIIISLGWLLTRLKIANENWLKPIGDFALYLGFPALIFGNLTKVNINFNLIESSFLNVSSLLLGMLILIMLVLKWITKSRQSKATYIICFLFGNAAFLGIPLLTSIDNSLSQVATLNASMMLFWVFSLGLFLVEWYTQEQPNIGKILLGLLKNPLLLAVLFGIGFNFLEIHIPTVIHKPIEMTGKAVSPMVMLMIGIFIACHPPRNFKSIQTPAIFSLFKLLIFPIIGILVLSQTNGNIEISSMTQFAMPAAITPFAMADRYGLKKDFVCNSIIVSTIISLFTLPVIIYLINFVNQ